MRKRSAVAFKDYQCRTQNDVPMFQQLYECVVYCVGNSEYHAATESHGREGDIDKFR